MKPINKAGKSSPSTLIAIIAVVALLVVGGLAFKFSGSATTTGQQTVVPGQPVPASASCAYQPTVTIAGTDALVASTDATPTTVNYILNGVYKGTTAPAVTQGDTWTIVGDKAGYLAAKSDLSVGCGAQTIQQKLFAYANATVTIKDDQLVSSNTLTNGGGAINSTAASAGGVRNFPVYFQGTSQKSSSDLFWVIETPANTQANVSSIVVTCNGIALSPKSIPAGIAAANAGSTRVAFEVPAVVGADQKSCNLQIVNTATGTVKGTLLNTFYAEQSFVDADGKVQYGTYDTSANGNNAAKYQDKFTYNIVQA